MQLVKQDQSRGMTAGTHHPASTRILYGGMKKWKIYFGSNRGIEFASQVNVDVIKGLWGHLNTEVKYIGNNCYALYDDNFKENPLPVTCEYFDIEMTL